MLKRIIQRAIIIACVLGFTACTPTPTDHATEGPGSNGQLGGQGKIFEPGVPDVQDAGPEGAEDVPGALSPDQGTTGGTTGGATTDTGCQPLLADCQ